mgnify:CR=1 FL=1
MSPPSPSGPSSAPSSPTAAFGAQIDVTDLWRIMENFGNRHEKVHRNMADFNRRSRKKSRSVFPPYNLDCVKFCQILPKFLCWTPHFSHASLQISPDSDLAFNARFELQAGSRRSRSRAGCWSRNPRTSGGSCATFGVQNAVTDLWRIMEKFGEIYEKI